MCSQVPTWIEANTTALRGLFFEWLWPRPCIGNLTLPTLLLASSLNNNINKVLLLINVQVPLLSFPQYIIVESSLSNVHAVINKNWNRWRPGRSTIPGDHNQGRATPKLGLWHSVFTDRFIFRHISEYLSRKNGISAPSTSPDSKCKISKRKTKRL